MGFVGWVVKGRGRQPSHIVPHEDAMTIAMEDGHWRNFPPAYLARMHPGEDRDPYRMSPSSLSDCVRCAILKTRHDYTLDAAQQFARLNGNAWHLYLDGAVPGHSELTVRHTFELVGPNGQDLSIPFTGRLDWLSSTGRLIDYKSTGTLAEKLGGRWVDKSLPSPEQELQTMAYVYLARISGHAVNAVTICYIARSGTFRAVEVPIWGADELENVMQHFVELRADAKLLAPRLPPRGDGSGCRWSPPEIRSMCEELP